MIQDGVTMNWDNKTVRQWYVNHCNGIINQIDKTASVEQQAKEVVADILKTATKTNKDVNNSFGL